MSIHGIFDSHAHYFDRRFEAETADGAAGILRSVMPEPVEWIVNVGTNPETSRVAIRQAAEWQGMYAAVGIHPEDCHFCEGSALDDLRALLGDTESRRKNKIVAIGEIGLDYHADFFGDQPLDRAREMRFFDAQIKLAEELDLPVIIHNRDAMGDCFEAILRHPNLRGVMHSYSGSPEMVRELVRRGWFISFSGTLTFRNAPRVREAAMAVPRDRFLIETDCPYMTPVPFRGKRNDPSLIVHTLDKLRELRGIDREELAEILYQNSFEAFGLQES